MSRQMKDLLDASMHGRLRGAQTLRRQKSHMRLALWARARFAEVGLIMRTSGSAIKDEADSRTSYSAKLTSCKGFMRS
jgi:hypothetical protein